MTERPNVLFVGLLAVAATTSVLLVAGLTALAGHGFEVLAATVVAAFSTCLLFLMGVSQLPLSSIVIVFFLVASVAALSKTLLGAVREARLLRSLPLRPIDDPELLSLAQASGIRRIYELPASYASAFCIGLLRPRVVLTEGLLNRLEGDERAAVIWHEGVHACAREPLKCLLARLAVRTFFWMPVLGELLDRYLLAKELDADRLATANTSRRALAGALSEVIGQRSPASAVGIAEFSAARVDRLFDPSAALPPLLRARSIVLSIGSAAALVLALAFPATLGAIQSEQMLSMLTSNSLLHGLPAMLAGLFANLVVLTLVAKLVRRMTRVIRQ